MADSSFKKSIDFLFYRMIIANYIYSPQFFLSIIPEPLQLRLFVISLLAWMDTVQYISWELM